MKSELKSKIIIIFLIIFATIGGYNSLIYADEQKKSYEYDMYENGSGKDITSDEAVKSEGDNLKEADGTDLFRTSNMGISQSGVDLIKQFEGCRLTAYKVTSSEKYYTIGYGHYGADVYAGMTITQAQAESMLKSDLVRFEGYVNTFLNKNNITINQNQFDALVSFTYNVGNVWVSYNTFQLKTYLINGVSNYNGDQITTAFTNWNKSGGVVLDGLTRRRKAEAALFLNGNTNDCSCSDSYAGDYVCTASSALNIRSGHGGTVIGTIPSGAVVYVSKGDGTWAHVSYNGINGCSSMQYLKKKQDTLNYQLHVWISDTDMGSVPEHFYKGKSYYLCYEILDTDTGKRVDIDHDGLNYSVSEVFGYPDGTKSDPCTYGNDYNWYRSYMGATGQYKGIVTVTGDINTSCEIGWKVEYSGNVTLKASTYSVNLNIPGNISQRVTLTMEGEIPDNCALSKDSSGNGFSAKWDGDWNGWSHDMVITGEGAGSGVIIVSVVDGKNASVKYGTIKIYVNVTKEQKTVSAMSGVKLAGRADDALRINWNINSSASGYIIEQYKNGNWSRIARIADKNTKTYRIEKLTNSTDYRFRIQGFNFDNGTPVYGSYTYVSGKTNPSKITGVKIGGRAVDALRLNWNKVSGASGYIIEKYENGKWNRIARIADVKTRTYRVEGLKASTTYKFRIKAFGFSGSTPLYSTYTYVNGRTTPMAVTGVCIGGTAKDALRVNWNKVSGASGYIIEKYENGNWNRVARIADGNTKTYRVEKLKKNTAYVFRIRAFDFDGNTPLYSDSKYVNGSTNRR